MNSIFDLPLPIRLAALFVLGTLVGTQLNRGIYRFAWQARPVGPWSPPDRRAPPRRPADRIPVVGWLGLRRESPLHGPGYWVRPMLIELLTGAGFVALYWWECVECGLIPKAIKHFGRAVEVDPPSAGTLHAQLAAHLILVSLMIVVTFIDLDEKTIPDAITLPGTLVGLVLAAVLPASALPEPVLVRGHGMTDALTLTSPLHWPAWLDGRVGLAAALACYAAWCLAVVPKTWWTRSGPIKAVRYLAASVLRLPGVWRYGTMLIVGAAAILAVWRSGGRSWQGLLTALVGAAFGGGLIWAVRIIGSAVLRREAMGFGDVTLMAMIGAYLGWQSTLIVFFLAPFAGLAIAVAQWLITGRKDIAYGPFLCAATLVLVVCWSPIWEGWGRDVFGLGLLLPILVAFCLVLMGGMLTVWQFIKERLWA